MPIYLADHSSFIQMICLYVNINVFPFGQSSNKLCNLQVLPWVYENNNESSERQINRFVNIQPYRSIDR